MEEWRIGRRRKRQADNLHRREMAGVNEMAVALKQRFVQGQQRTDIKSVASKLKSCLRDYRRGCQSPPRLSVFSVPSVSSIQVTRGLQRGGYRDPAGSQKVKR